MKRHTAIIALTGCAALLFLAACDAVALLLAGRAQPAEVAGVQNSVPPAPELDREEYDRRLRVLANIPETTAPEVGVRAWPAEAPYPNAGAILPFHRVVAYYGNFLSRYMGVLGEYPEEVVLAKLRAEVAAWEAADPDTPVVPAIDYIAITAQRGPGRDGKYRLRMLPAEIDKAMALAKKVDGIVILEVQPGLADVLGEVRSLEKYLALPQVHLAVDPEFAMKDGSAPGTRVGTVSAAEVNRVADYLAGLVRDHGLPPKLLVVHRYTQAMVTRAADIAPLPEVQVVVDMDGWGHQSTKFGTYNAWIAAEPVQFTGFKVFYKNDLLRPGSRVLTPAEILTLRPRPSFIQYQ
jgi:hypothetical protein